MSTSHRICETCVYCSFAGNCDRHDKPLTSIEQPACDAYEIHPLLAENAKLRELVRTFYHCTTSGECDECPINGGGPVRLMPDTICDTIHDRMRELGVEV